jgi:hypothetical protein
MMLRSPEEVCWSSRAYRVTPHGVRLKAGTTRDRTTERSELNNAVRSQFRARASVKAYLVLI